MKVSLCMIVKNEQDRLEKCIESVKDVVDEYVIVDTGSTDNTKDIIAKYGRVYSLPFEDFVKTKNRALGFASGDYILWMDADEYIYEGIDVLKKYVVEGKVDAVYCKITEGPDDNLSVVRNQYDRIRMWRRGTHSFWGPGIHEVAVPTVDNVNYVFDKTIKVRHEHRGEEKKRRFIERADFYINTLKSYIERGECLSRAIFYLARTYRDLGSLHEAIGWYLEYIALEGLTYRDEIFQAHYDLACCYKMLGEYDKAEHWLMKAREIDPRRAEPHVMIGDIEFQRGNYNDALMHYEQAIKPIPDDITLFLDPLLYNIYPKDQKFLCLYYLKRYDEAEKVIDELIRETKDLRVINNKHFVTVRKYPNVFMCLGDTPEPVYGGIIEKQGVGGVETTYVELASELNKLGLNVFLFCNTEEEHIYDGVYYVPYDEIENYVNINPSFVITSRWFEPFYMLNNAVKIIWYQDAFFPTPNHPDLYDVCNVIVCSSKWHNDYIIERIGSRYVNKLKIIPLGIRKELFYGNDAVKRERWKIIYSSNPQRGLFELLDMWGDICKELPDVSLTVTYGWEGLLTWSSDEMWQKEIKSMYDKCLEYVREYGNIKLVGRLKKRDLAMEMLSSRLLAYPCNFWETFCLTALEAQASGLPIVTSDFGALSYVVNRENNILLPGYPTTPSYKKFFVKSVVGILKDYDVWQRISYANRQYVANLKCDWKDIAKEWKELFYACC